MAVDGSVAYGDIDSIEGAGACSGESVEIFDLCAGAVVVGLVEQIEFAGGQFFCHGGLFADVADEPMFPLSFCAGYVLFAQLIEHGSISRMAANAVSGVKDGENASGIDVAEDGIQSVGVSMNISEDCDNHLDGSFVGISISRYKITTYVMKVNRLSGLLSSNYQKTPMDIDDIEREITIPLKNKA